MKKYVGQKDYGDIYIKYCVNMFSFVIFDIKYKFDNNYKYTDIDDNI